LGINILVASWNLHTLVLRLRKDSLLKSTLASYPFSSQKCFLPQKGVRVALCWLVVGNDVKTVIPTGAAKGYYRIGTSRRAGD